jgi:hypothetical protein
MSSVEQIVNLAELHPDEAESAALRALATVIGTPEAAPPAESDPADDDEIDP